MKRLLACLLSVALFLLHLVFAEDDAIPASFKFGADVSTVLSEENSGVVSRRCKEAGLSLIVDFHYSDFWADPAKQMSPKAWVTMDLTQKCSALYAFTTDALTQIAATGVDVWMVQVGNEINGGMAGAIS